MVFADGIVCYPYVVLKLRRIDLLVLACDVESGYPKTLQIFLFKVGLSL